MSIKYAKKKQKQSTVLSTVITVILLCSVILAMVINFSRTAEEEAYETLHLQTKQIKDDITLQLLSDRENLQTMANFAAKLYKDGESYNIMFDSFKSIGLIENIGILNPDNVFVTKVCSINLDGLISFHDERKRGAYISTRVQDLTNEGNELIRTAVPINVDGKTVGILYGVISLDKIGERYGNMAKDFDAQLFVYDKKEGNLVVDTVHKTLGNISFLKDRNYVDDYSYEEFITSDKGFISFRSAYRDENLHMHYSSIDEIGWCIAMGRYDSQVFAKTHEIAKVILLVFLAIICIIALYFAVLITGDRLINEVTNCASEVRKELLETVDGQNNIFDALVLVRDFAKSRSAIFFDTNGDEYHYISPEFEGNELLKNDRHYFKTELIRFASELYNINNNTLNVMCIKPNKHLQKTNETFYNFLKEHGFNDVSFAAVINNTNHITILGTVNAKNGKGLRLLAEKVIACFSMALHNKNHINKTEIAATTDPLTGVLNRVSYNNDMVVFDKEQATDFSCVYIDVNELHICNNKYGHAAGDEMLLYIANALKESYSGHKIYRIGGDEFLVFTKNTPYDVVKSASEDFVKRLEPRNYHVSIGVSYRAQNLNTNEVVREAEVRMYEEKALYYQNKEQQGSELLKNKDYVQIKTGILEIDTMISIINEKYNGIYRVSLETDKARRILMPAYLKYNENEEHFSNLVSRYVSESVEPDYHRAVTSFLNYDVIRRQLAEGKTPKIRYKKNNGETVVLSVYKLGEGTEVVNETLWVFAKE